MENFNVAEDPLHKKFCEATSSEGSSQQIADLLFGDEISRRIILNSAAHFIRKQGLDSKPEDYLAPLYEFIAFRISTWTYQPTSHDKFQGFLWVVVSRAMQKLALGPSKIQTQTFDLDSLIGGGHVDEHSLEQSLLNHVTRFSKGKRRLALVTMILTGGDVEATALKCGIQEDTVRRYVSGARYLLDEWVK